MAQQESPCLAVFFALCVGAGISVMLVFNNTAQGIVLGLLIVVFGLFCTYKYVAFCASFYNCLCTTRVSRSHHLCVVLSSQCARQHVRA